MKIKMWVCFLVISLMATRGWSKSYWSPRTPTGGAASIMLLGSSAIFPVIINSTSDGADNSALMVAGGGDTSPTRGAYITLYGNEASGTPGNLELSAGSTGLILSNSIFNIGTATNWQLGGVAYTGTMANLNSVRDGSVLTTQHYHSALSASDGSPNPALSVDATGNVGIGTATPGAKNEVFDGDIFIGKTGVAHGMTTIATTTTAGRINVPDGYGRLDIYGLSESGARGGMALYGYAGGTPVLEDCLLLIGGKANGTGVQNLSATDLMLGYFNGSTRLGGIDGSGRFYIGNETTNANSTIGLIINQGANDDEIMAFKSSDVNHNMTDQAEYDTYADIGKENSADGGVYLKGLTDSTSAEISAITLIAIVGGAADTAHDATALGATNIRNWFKSGITVTSVSANGDLFTVQNGTSTKFIVDAEGDLFADGTLAAYDYADDGSANDDVALISTLDKLHAEMTDKKLVASEWEDFVKYNEDDLIKMGILGGKRVGVPKEERGLVNFTGLVSLHNGAIRQLGRSANETEYRVGSVEQRVAELEMRELFYSPTILGRN